MTGVKLSLKIQRNLKRLIDILVSGFVLIVTLPFLIIISIAIKLESQGPVTYRHQRIGRNGKVFNLIKFRSMIQGSDDGSYMQYLKELIESDQGKNGNGKPYRKMEEDPRITRIGSFLRKYYLDELPQFWNILKGEMSLVGPRPHVQFEVDYYTPEQYKRLSVRPGATGIWQVEGKGNCSFNELIDLDLQYIDQWNLGQGLGLDFKIINQTILLMVGGGEQFWARQNKNIPSTRKNGNNHRNNGNGLSKLLHSPVELEYKEDRTSVEIEEKQPQKK
jgi:lipopolysaccharide/colanic/teichoic acid biosynthesis glycosyltransferase